MKRLFVIFAVMFMSLSAFADVTWLSKEDIEDFQSTINFDIEVLAIAKCDSQEEAEKVCKVYSLDEFFLKTITTNNRGLNNYTVIFIDGGPDYPRIFVYHYMYEGQVEIFMLF